MKGTQGSQCLLEGTRGRRPSECSGHRAVGLGHRRDGSCMGLQTEGNPLAVSKHLQMPPTAAH